MNTLEELFRLREQAFDEGTALMFDELYSVTNTIVEFLNLTQKAKENKVKWHEISFIKRRAKESDDYIMLVGTVEYSIGEQFVTVSGELIEVTDDTLDYFNRYIRVGLPFMLATTGTREDILSYFNETQFENQKEYVDSNTTTSNELSFKLDDLSDEQRKSLELFSTIGGNSKHE